jgi:hypothetical protein
MDAQKKEEKKSFTLHCLVFSGRVLKDSQLLEALDFEDDTKFIVVMPAEAKAAQPGSSCGPADAPAPAAAEAKKEETMDDAAASAPVATPAAASAEPAAGMSEIAADAASTLLSGQALEDVVMNIMDMDMGYERDQVGVLSVCWGLCYPRDLCRQRNDIVRHVPSARLTLQFTKLCTKFNILREKIFFVTKINSETFLSISQNLKVTRLQGCTQTKLSPC